MGENCGRVAAIVLAAGQGSRFGGLKQIALLAGKPLLEYPLSALKQAGISERVVVLGSGARLVQDSICLHGATIVECADWQHGQSRSLASGVAAVSEADATLVLLGDQPMITPEAITRLVESRKLGISALRATYNGRLGHPVLLEAGLFSRCRSVEGDVGARRMLRSEFVLPVACEDVACDLDVDSPEALGAVQRMMSARARE